MMSESVYSVYIVLDKKLNVIQNFGNVCSIFCLISRTARRITAEKRILTCLIPYRVLVVLKVRSDRNVDAAKIINENLIQYQLSFTEAII